MTRLYKTLDQLTELYDLWFLVLSNKDPMFWVSEQAKEYDTFLSMFSSTLAYCKSHSHNVWDYANREQRIAMIVLFDQIPRHIFRGTCKMYAYDYLGIYYAKRINYTLNVFEFMYILMPYQHSEKIEDHHLGVHRLYRYRKHSQYRKDRMLQQLENAFDEHTQVLRVFDEYPKRRLDCGYTLETLPHNLRTYIEQSTHPYI